MQQRRNKHRTEINTIYASLARLGNLTLMRHVDEMTHVTEQEDQWENQPEDTVSGSHNVESINESASTDVVVITIIVQILLERNLKESRDQTHTDEAEDCMLFQK